jgi:outer membrane protein assembly factor BamB
MHAQTTPRRAAAGGLFLLAAGLGLAAYFGADGPALVAAGDAPAAADGRTEHRMFGDTPARNMANLKDKFAPVLLLTKEGEDAKQPAAAVKWQADLGSRAYGGPTVAGGKVYVGTNNERPRNKRDEKKNADGEVEPIDKGVLMVFNEGDGKFLWQAVFDKLPSGQVHDWPKEGLCSSPAVEGNRVYFVSNRCTVVCADVNGLADGKQGAVERKGYTDPTDADVIWELNMMGKDLGVFPHNMAASSPLIVGDILYVTTANGVDEGHLNIPAPQAPSFLAIDKHSGKVLWKRNDPGRNIMHGQWSNATYGEIKGVRQVIFPGGDGWLRGMKPETGEVLWQCDCNPKESKYELGGTGTRNDFIGTPVVYKDRVYIGVGQDPEHFSGVGHFWCIDPSKGGDISPELGPWGQKGQPNPNSGVVWHYGGPDARKFVPRDFVFGRTMSTACIVDDVLYISELQGFIHCLDANTGKKFWQYDTKGAIWGSPYYVDGKVYLASESGDLFCFKHDKTPAVIDELDIPDAKDGKDFNTKRRAKVKDVEKAYLLGKTEFDAPIRSTPVVAGGVMYVMTEKTLYALTAKK